MIIIVIIKFMRISFEVSSVAATKLPSGWCPLEIHRYFPVHVEQTLHLFCKLFLSRRHTASLVIGAFFNNDAIWRLW